MNQQNAIKVLQDQMGKLDAKDFDLNAWKNFTTLLLERIFGQHTKKIDAIRKIKYDQGSWVLRDETGYTNSIEACIKLGREILEEAIVELEAFGTPEEKINTIPFEIILNALQDELTGSQFREIKKALEEERQIKDLKKILITKLKGFGSEGVYAIVANILSNEEVMKNLHS
jgi:hypothetical protein